MERKVIKLIIGTAAILAVLFLLDDDPSQPIGKFVIYKGTAIVLGLTSYLTHKLNYGNRNN